MAKKPKISFAGVGSAEDDSPFGVGDEAEAKPELAAEATIEPLQAPVAESEDGSLPVEDLDSVLVSPSLREDWRKEIRLQGKDKYEVLIFDREGLVRRFPDRRGMLVLAKVTASEWFQRILKDNGFKHLINFEKDQKGRYLLRSKTEDAYEVSQRYLV